MSDIYLGRTSTGEEVRLPLTVFLRHVICLGNSGSGKTVTCKVICEEFVRNGIPIIAVDPQGDIASLGILGKEEELAAHGLPSDLRDEFAARAEVVVWTPGSSVGVPLCVNPLAATTRACEGVSPEEAMREQVFAAEALADFANFDLRSPEGQTVKTLFNLAIEHAAQNMEPLSGISALLRLLEAMPVELRDRIGSIAEDKLLAEVIRRVRLLSMDQGLLLSDGLTLDIDTLLGRSPAATAAAPGKTRLSVIYLNTLPTQKEREFFVGQLAQALYRWMVRHPSAAPQALFFVDEIAPFLPPVRKPVCKDALGQLFRKARKYGVACLAATQSAGDLDYQALGQVSTWSLGRLSVQQEVKKVQGQLRALNPDAAIAQRLPALLPGQAILLSPDVFKTPQEYQVRWLLTQHRTLDDQAIASVTEPALRQRLFQAIEDVADVEAGQTESADDAVAGPAVGKATVAVLYVTRGGKKDEVGTVGSCEIVVRRGTGHITPLGGQSKVSRESIKVAWEAASLLQNELALPHNCSSRYNMTLLDTRLAVKKDGPSAGLAYLTGIVAALRGKPPRQDVAMTGEITIHGKVLGVGGIQPKVEAAYQAGYATVLVPAENRHDVDNLPAALRQQIEIVPVASVHEALPVIFGTPRRQNPEPPRKLPVAILLPPERKTILDEPEQEPAEEQQPELVQRVSELLLKEPTAFSAKEVSERLSEAQPTVTKVLKRLAEEGKAKNAKRGRESVWYDAQHALRPEYGLFGPVEAAKLVVLEPDARRRAESTLASSLLIFTREEVIGQRLTYFPLYKVHFAATVSEGWIFTSKVEKRDNLFFHGLNGELLSFQDKSFAFAAAVPSNPVDVVDLDNLASFEWRSPGELELSEAEMKGLAKTKDIEASVLRKFQLQILGISLLFFPVWRFHIRDKQEGTMREFVIDGIKGQPIVLGAGKGGKNRS